MSGGLRGQEVDYNTDDHVDEMDENKPPFPPGDTVLQEPEIKSPIDTYPTQTHKGKHQIHHSHPPPPPPPPP